MIDVCQTKLRSQRQVTLLLIVSTFLQVFLLYHYPDIQGSITNLFVHSNAVTEQFSCEFNYLVLLFFCSCYEYKIGKKNLRNIKKKNNKNPPPQIPKETRDTFT